MNFTDPASLASACFARLAEEEAFLGEALTALQAVRAAVLENNADALDAALKHQGRVIQGLGRARDNRLAFQQAGAIQAGLPADHVTMASLLPHLDPADRAKVQTVRQRVRELARQVDRHARLVAGLAEDFLTILDQVFRELIGGADTAGVRYDLRGAQRAPISGSVFQAQG